MTRWTVRRLFFPLASLSFYSFSQRGGLWWNFIIGKILAVQFYPYYRTCSSRRDLILSFLCKRKTQPVTAAQSEFAVMGLALDQERQLSMAATAPLGPNMSGHGILQSKYLSSVYCIFDAFCFFFFVGDVSIWAVEIINMMREEKCVRAANSWGCCVLLFTISLLVIGLYLMSLNMSQW